MFKNICTELDDGTVEELCKVKCKELGRKQPSYVRVYKCVTTEFLRKPRGNLHGIRSGNSGLQI
jgi:hypothetical protein